MAASTFTVKRKGPDEFCAESLPWKATNGTVCSDARTREEAVATAQSLNLERGQPAGLDGHPNNPKASRIGRWREWLKGALGRR